MRNKQFIINKHFKHLMAFMILLAVFILFLNFVSADFTKGNLTADIETNYGPGDILKGWINISLEDEPDNSLLTAFDSEISILDFLEKLTVNYDCVPIDCKKDYSVSNKVQEKTFSLSNGESKIIGFKITGEDVEITGFSANIISNAGESSSPQLKIDILNDKDNEEGYIEWQSYKASGDYDSEIKGCYNSGTEQAEITQTAYCEKINIPAAPKIKTGANIQEVVGKGGNVNFEMRIYNDDYDGSCEASASGSGKISCEVNINIREKQDFFVCINTKNSADNNKYKINYEETNPCGFTGDFNDEYTHDFDVFAQAGKFAAVGSFILNNAELENAESEISNLADYIDSYIGERYNYECSDDCIVPIKFISGKSQTITLSNAELSYNTGISKTTKDIYDLSEKPALINMDFKKLDLEKANLTVPTSYGDKNLVLKLDGEEIVEQEIEITKVPVIEKVIPSNVPAAISTKFIVYVSGNESNYNYTYKWDFGDATAEQTTSINSIYHTYPQIGAYTLEIEVEDNLGKTSSKKFSISVKSPKEIANKTLEEYREKIDSIIKQIEGYSFWYKSKLEKQAGLDDIDAGLKTLERKYEIASTTSEYVEIMSKLTELEVPHTLQISESSSGDYFIDKKKVEVSYLTEIDKEVDNPQAYAESILIWMNENINIQLERKVYSLHYDDKTEHLITYFVLKIKPIQDFSRESYLIIDKNYDLLSFKENYNEKSAGAATSITFSELNTGQEKTIEFVVSEKIELLGLPIYVSSEFSQLPEAGIIEPCNFNNECEPELDETWKNCRNDCKPWNWVFIWMIILLFFAFVAYIILQEWYKRYYETHLFKNKNELYNLIYFINNALNQSYSIQEIIKTLKKHGWKTEQIAYALKKVKGERTGMWEIPVFKWLEKRKIDEEIRKRQQMQTLKKSFQQNPK